MIVPPPLDRQMLTVIDWMAGSIQYEVGVAGTRLNDWLGIRANHWFIRRSFRKVTWRTPIGGSEYGGYEEMMNLINSNQDPPVDLYDLKGSDKGDNKIDSLTMEPSDIPPSNGRIRGEHFRHPSLTEKREIYFQYLVGDLEEIERYTYSDEPCPSPRGV
ncbi:hypothetical protein Tco_1317966 [Tanacetum coccineum]